MMGDPATIRRACGEGENGLAPVLQAFLQARDFTFRQDQTAR
jgi:hypothetical protein